MKSKRLLTGILCGLILANLTSCSMIDSIKEIISYVKTDNNGQNGDTDETDVPYTETDDTKETESSVTEPASTDSSDSGTEIKEPETVIDDNSVNNVQNISETVVEVENLDSIISAVRDNGQFCAMASLGYFGSTWESLSEYLEDGYTELYPFLNELTESRFACGDGVELYLVIPGDTASSVKVEQLDNSGNIEKVLYQSDSGSFFVMQGNDIIYTDDDSLYGEKVYNLQFTITKPNGESFTCLSGRDFSDGDSFNPDMPVLDLTQISRMKLQSVDSNVIVGLWYGYVIPEDGRDSFGVSFEFKEDGTMSYVLGNYTESYDLEHYYKGTWKRIEPKQLGKPGSVYVFDLTHTESIDGAKHTVPEKIYSRQYITTNDYIEEAVVIQIVDCDSLYPNNYEYQVFLYPSEG